MDEPNITNMVKANDIDYISENVDRLIKRGERILRYQQNELDLENDFAEKQINNINYYYYLTLFQIVAVIAFVAYQLYAFRKHINLDYFGFNNFNI
jgi:hypothetical protein